MRKNWRIRRHAIERAADIFNCSMKQGCQEILHKLEGARPTKLSFGRRAYKTLRYWGTQGDIEFLWNAGLLFTVKYFDSTKPIVITVTKKKQKAVRFA